MKTECKNHKKTSKNKASLDNVGKVSAMGFIDGKAVSVCAEFDCHDIKCLLDALADTLKDESAIKCRELSELVMKNRPRPSIGFTSPVKTLRMVKIITDLKSGKKREIVF